MIPYNKNLWRWLFSAIGGKLQPGTPRKSSAMESGTAEAISGCEMYASDSIRVMDANLANFQRVVLDKDVTVGMSAYGNYSTTLTALRSLFHSAEGDFELILVDDNSPDNVRSLFMEAKREHPNTKVLGFEKNIEYSGSLNAILSHAQGNWMLFLSNDIFVTPSYLRELFAIARMRPDFGIVRGCSNFVDNGLPSHNIEFPGGYKSYEQLFEFAEGIATRHHEQYIFDEFLIGDAFLVSQAVIEKIGTFDPLFYGYFADIDFGIRARVAGFNLVMTRGGFAYHHQDANFNYLADTERQKKLARRWAKVHENWARFKLKYRLPIEQPYTGAMGEIPWHKLSNEQFDPVRHYVAPGDYSASFL